MAISGHSVLQEHNPRLLKSMALRNPYIDPLNVIQAGATTPSFVSIFTLLTRIGAITTPFVSIYLSIIGHTLLTFLISGSIYILDLYDRRRIIRCLTVCIIRTLLFLSSLLTLTLFLQFSLTTELLRRLRVDGAPVEDEELLRDALLITINGIANGMKNSG